MTNNRFSLCGRALRIGDNVEIAYGQAPGYWRITEFGEDGSIFVEQIKDTHESDASDQGRRVRANHITRIISDDDVILKQSTLRAMRRDV